MTKESTYKVYMHRNKLNGKIYIGCTKKSLSARSDNGNGYKKCTRFWADIEKYGFDAFDHVILQDNLTKDNALELEEKLVDAFDTMNPERGYNMRKGGIHNVPCQEVGEHISMAKIGHIVTSETRAKLSQYGRKSVAQIDQDNNVIAIHDSLTDAAKAVSGFKSNIFAVCAGRKHTYKGYKWRYAKGVM